MPSMVRAAFGLAPNPGELNMVSAVCNCSKMVVSDAGPDSREAHFRDAIAAEAGKTGR